MAHSSQNILVIKLGALGDFIQAMGPMAAIRKAHPDAQITLLTTASFESFAKACGYFGQIWIDEKPNWVNIGGWLRLRKKLRNGAFARVYDLQNNDRSTLYFKLFNANKRPEWVGTATGASHQNTSPQRTAGHAFDGHIQTLGLAGITDIEIDTLDWLEEDISILISKRPISCSCLDLRLIDQKNVGRRRTMGHWHKHSRRKDIRLSSSAVTSKKTRPPLS